MISTSFNQNRYFTIQHSLCKSPGRITSAIILCLFLSTLVAQFDWVDDGLMISPYAYIHDNFATAPGAVGEYIIVWADTRNGDYDIFAKMMDHLGNIIWTQDVVIAPGDQINPTMVSDGNGGVYIGWSDYEPGPQNPDIYIQHVTHSGDKTWCDRGRPLTNIAGAQFDLILKPVLGAGAVAAWVDSYGCGPKRMYVTWINESGPLNEGVGSYVTSFFGLENFEMDIAAVSDTIACVVWKKANFIEGDYFRSIHAQRIRHTGELLWGEDDNGLIIRNEQHQMNTPLVSMTVEDEIILIWNEKAEENENLPFIQILNSNGESQLPGDILSLAPDADIHNTLHHQVILQDQNVYIAWVEQPEDTDLQQLFIQGYNPGNGLLFGPGGMSINEPTDCSIDVDQFQWDNNGIYLSWIEYGIDGGSVDKLRLQHISSDGSQFYPEGGSTFIPEQTDNGHIRLLISGNSTALWSWKNNQSGGSSIFGTTLDLISGVPAAESMMLAEGSNMVLGDFFFAPSEITGAIMGWKESRFGYSPDLEPNILKLQPITSDQPFPPLVQFDDFNGSSLKAVDLNGNLFMTYNANDGPWGAKMLHYQLFEAGITPVFDDPNPAVFGPGLMQSSADYYLIRDDAGIGYVIHSGFLSDSYESVLTVNSYDGEGSLRWMESINFGEFETVPQAVTPRPGGGCYIFATQIEWPIFDLYLIGFDENGNAPPGWENQSILIEGNVGYGYDVSLASTPDGISIIWTDMIADQTVIRMAQYTHTGQPINSGITTLTDGTETVYQHKQLYNTVRDKILVCWQGYNDLNDGIFCREVDTVSDTLGPIIDVSVADAEYTQLGWPDIKCSTSGETEIVWEARNDSGEYDIFFQAYSASDFEPIFTAGGIPLCNAPLNQHHPKIELLPGEDDQFIIFWRDSRHIQSFAAQSYTPGNVICGTGDPNTDGQLDILDIVMTVDMTIQPSSYSVFQLCSVDMNDDGETDILDILILVEMILL